MHHLILRTYKMRLSIILTGRTAVSQWMITMGLNSCVTAVQFCPDGLALCSFVAFAFGLPSPTYLLVHGGPLCPGKYTYSPLRLPCNRYQTSFICILPTFACSCIACFAVNWYLTSILNIANQQLSNYKIT